MESVAVSEVNEVVAPISTAPPAASPRGMAIQDDLLADFGIPATGAVPKQQARTLQQLTLKRQRLLSLARDAVGYAKEPSVHDVLNAAWKFWHRYALYNGILIVCQRPSATHVETPSTWMNKFGMVPKPNEQPLLILQQGGPLNFVFDASQMEAGSAPGTHAYAPWEPFARPTFSHAPQVLATMIESIKAHGVRVQDHALGQARGGHIIATSPGISQEAANRGRPTIREQIPVCFDVSLNSALDETAQLGVLTHELGHLYCGHVGQDPALGWTGEGLWVARLDLSQAQKEAEAESVSQLVMRLIAPGSAPYREVDIADLPDDSSAIAVALASELVLATIESSAVKSH